MKFITTINSDDLSAFMNLDVDALMLGLKDYCIYLDKEFSLEEIKKITSSNKEKEFYVIMNRIINNDEIKEAKNVLKELASFDIAGIVILDMGLLREAKELNILDKIVFAPSTYITNKDSAKYFSSYGVKRIMPSNEISLNNIIDIKEHIDCEMEITVYGHCNIFYSRRPIISLYNENYNSDVDVSYLRETQREELLPIKQTKNGTFVFTGKPLNLIKYIPALLENNVDFWRFENNFVNIEELEEVIGIYRKMVKLCKENKKLFEEEVEKLDLSKFDEGFINKDSVYLQEDY